MTYAPQQSHSETSKAAYAKAEAEGLIDSQETRIFLAFIINNYIIAD